MSPFVQLSLSSHATPSILDQELVLSSGSHHLKLKNANKYVDVHKNQHKKAAIKLGLLMF